LSQNKKVIKKKLEKYLTLPTRPPNGVQAGVKKKRLQVGASHSQDERRDERGKAAITHTRTGRDVPEDVAWPKNEKDSQMGGAWWGGKPTSARSRWRGVVKVKPPKKREKGGEGAKKGKRGARGDTTPVARKVKAGQFDAE